MKKIHPKYYSKAKIVCACGNVINAGSTVPEMQVEICSKCHPFYTGKQTLVDTSGRLERYKKLIEKKEKIAQAKQAAKKKKAKK
jgi:large subunit ribosomal protein L31